MSRTCKGKKPIGNPSQSRQAKPLAIPHIPKVAIKGGTLNLATKYPLIIPGISPNKSPPNEPAMIEIIGEKPAAFKSRIIIEELMQTKPITKPMERSIPPLIITKVSPLANKSRELTPRIILLKFLRLKKYFPKKLNKINMDMRKMNAQFLPTKSIVLFLLSFSKSIKKSLFDLAIKISFYIR